MKKLFTAILSAVLLFSLSTAYAQSTTGMIQFQTYGGPDANAYFVPASRATDRVLIVFHEWYGLTENMKKQAEDWQKQLEGNVTIYAIDLYDGKTTTDKFVAGKMMNNLDPIRAEAIINGLLQKIGPGRQIATLGYGMGGTWAFTAAALAGGKAAGCVMFYGYPTKDDSRFKQLKTDVLYLYGNADAYITLTQVDQFGKKVTDAGRGFTLHTFRGGNGFANIGDPSINPVAASETAYLTLAFLKHKLSL